MNNNEKITLRLPQPLKIKVHELAIFQKKKMNPFLVEILQAYVNKPENLVVGELRGQYQEILQRKAENTRQIDSLIEEDRLVREEAIREMESLNEFQRQKLRISILNCLKRNKTHMTESEIAYEIDAEEPDLILAACSFFEKQNVIKQDLYLKFYISP